MRNADMDALLAALAGIFAGEGREAALRSAALLRGAMGGDLWAAQPNCGFEAELFATASAPGAHPAAALVAAAQPCLPWGTNPADGKLSAEAAAATASATLLGPGDPIRCEDLLVGLFWQRPGSYYALHNHDADETYVILAGGAVWRAGADKRRRGPGEMIHHPSGMPHAFQAGPQGLLAAWRWSGDVNFQSYTMLPDPEAPPEAP
ncbi:dimethylsulfonioproprionate lyase family protein [Xinfangfangia pollutisoli]|uniref:dimethylsulfonioproprionate lyase family protein n=1 Tax=Xinfangfangia pollutisoli TaxID=2865960 RepID=UPI001CD4DB56|nr:dimethylsulfonioproprionate lyase family protein [Xinfangfangia pollutisoli]